ncbi:MAG: hypothetical protein GY929_24615 [Actinomycetia bacterium]|nr:hypothetical protein [Actinomycetes bacterium]
MAVQLRRYEVEPGRLDDLVAWFPKIIPVRQQYGFTVDFAYADHDNNQFVWAVSHPGSVEDYEAAMKSYDTSPERAAIFEGFNSPVKAMTVAFVDSAL